MFFTVRNFRILSAEQKPGLPFPRNDQVNSEAGDGVSVRTDHRLNGFPVHSDHCALFIL